MISKGGRRGGRVALLAGALAAVLSACGDDGSDAGPLIVPAGHVDVQLPEGFSVSSGADPTTPSEAPPTSAGSGSGGEAAPEPTPAPVDEPADTIPLNEDDEPAASRLLDAVGGFNACLEDEGVEFIGAPDPSNPATQDPAYLESLSTCAARTNIVQVLAEAQAEEENLSPEEIEQRNESYLVWRECMVGRGWGIPEPVPDEKGRLFSMGGGGQDGAGFRPPPGESLLDSDDLAECADQAADEAED